MLKIFRLYMMIGGIMFDLQDEEILTYVIEGYSNKEIANIFNTTEDNVKFLIRTIVNQFSETSLTEKFLSYYDLLKELSNDDLLDN